MIYNKKSNIFFQLTLISIIFLVYLYSINFPLYGWDDIYYITNNKHIKLSIENIFYWFSNPCLGCYIPVTMVSFMLDYSIMGYNPLIYHLQNIIWHVITVLVIFNCLKFFNIRLWIAFFICIIFAVHPQRIESVVWLAERKDVLCAAFYFLSIYFFIKKTIKYNTNSPNSFPILSLIFFILAILSKPMAISLPLILLIFEWYLIESSNQKFNINMKYIIDDSNINDSRKRLKLEVINFLYKKYYSLSKIILQKKLYPFFLILICFVPITVLYQEDAINDTYSLIHTVYTIIYNFYWYVTQTLFCTELNPIYPVINIRNSIYQVILFYFAVVILGILIFIKAKKIYIISCIQLTLCYLISIGPVVGIIKLGNTDHTDRYSYIPSVFILFTMALLLEVILNKNVKPKFSILSKLNYYDFFNQIFIFGLLFFYSAVLIYFNYQYQRIWKNRNRLFTYSSSLKTPNNYSLFLLSQIEYNNGNYNEAIRISNILMKDRKSQLLGAYIHGRSLYQIDKTKGIKILLKVESVFEKINKSEQNYKNKYIKTLMTILHYYRSINNKQKTQEYENKLLKNKQ